MSQPSVAISPRRRMALSISHSLRRVPVLEIEFTVQGGNADPEHVRCFFA
jgi:hypothetical protein